MYLLGRYLEFVAPEVSRLSLAPILGDIRESMLAEVDFSREAHHLTTFSDFLDSAGLRGVATAPYVYRQYSSTRWVMQREGEGAGRACMHAWLGCSQPSSMLIRSLAMLSLCWACGGNAGASIWSWSRWWPAWRPCFCQSPQCSSKGTGASRGNRINQGSQVNPSATHAAWV